MDRGAQGELNVARGHERIELMRQNEMAIVLRMSVPVFTTQAAEWSLVLASVISIGHQGTTELAASS